MSKITQYTLLALLMVGLVACGGDVKEAPKTKSETPATTAPAEPAKAPEPEKAEADTDDSKAYETSDAKVDETKDDKADDKAKTDEKADDKASNTQDHASLSADAGQKRYEATCKLCHDQGLLNAPKKGDKAEWAKRLAKGKDTLYTHSIKGFNKMPAQAVGDVSEAEVKLAVDYLIAQSS